MSSAFGRVLNDFDVVVFFQRLGQTETNIAAAGNHQAMIGFLKSTQLAHHFANILFRRDKENLIAIFNNGFSGGKDRAIFTKHRGHSGIGIGHMFF